MTGRVFLKLRGVPAAVLATMLALVAMLAPASAAAEPTSGSQLALSLDGIVWESEPSSPLFSTTTLVPGDRLSATVFVRNDAHDGAQLSVVPEDIELHSLATHPFSSDLTLSVREPRESAQPLAFDELDSAVLYESRLDPGQVRELIVEVALPRSASTGGDANWDRASFALRVTLGGDFAVIPGGQADSDDGGIPGESSNASREARDAATDDVLPWTGGSAGLHRWALIAIGLGVAAAFVDRRLRALQSVRDRR
ncbi:hypothetical protein [Paramicrobacterium agarici]|uniref:LPXTG-motif cell wall-anchored protein n=1 Tax=Paramicrobacterium agarici TaxID=630514 RepID=A0A2A9DSS7_9MICO|nr:hypothetical protein [Microbacterium agarici]PFG29406.1 hypothetical protein ATJ78_0311 [Microbacterium agarici]